MLVQNKPTRQHKIKVLNLDGRCEICDNLFLYVKNTHQILRIYPKHQSKIGSRRQNLSTFA